MLDLWHKCCGEIPCTALEVHRNECDNNQPMGLSLDNIKNDMKKLHESDSLY
jgi:hypothetical protein